MKRMMWIMTLLLALSIAIAAAAEPGRVTVTGNAQVTTATDHAVIRLGIRTQADTPSEAQEENKTRTNAVMKAITEECGIAEDKVATSNFSIYTLSEWSEETGKERQYYQVMHQLSVTVDNIDQTGAVIDICVRAGANIVDYVSFESNSVRDAYDRALQEAIADAKRKAELIAGTVGLKLGDIVQVTANSTGGSDFYNNTYRMADEEAADGASTKLSPGTQSTGASVTVTWELVQP